MSASQQPSGDAAAGMAFVTTRWTMVMQAQGESPAADAALEHLCRVYWRPLYEFVRRQGARPEEAQDLTQAFFERLLERRDLDAVRREKGRLRSYLLVSLKNFLMNERRRATALKRGAGRPLIPLDEILAHERGGFEPADALTADRIFERRWALTVLGQTLARIEEEYREAGNADLFAHLKDLLTDEPGRAPQSQIAAALQMNENALKQALFRMRKRYRMVLREEIAQTVATPGDVDDEMRELIRILRT